MGYAARMMGLVVVWAGMAIGVEQDHPVPAHAQLHRALQQHLHDQRLRYFGALPFAEVPGRISTWWRLCSSTTAIKMCGARQA